ncbi:hypothetical protein [Achromobacter animicus]|uniref:hypothetical protein n=1 Tax=Achromobacter animicus TaxID=1389935 RepID=UPI0015827FF2|nr:hypothetical protein [Achromobacter animicus]
MRFFLHAIFLGAVCGVLGHALISFGFLRPADGEAVNRVEIHATGTKDTNSKGAEVWFRGAFEIGEDKKVPWDRFEVDSSWAKRDGIYISYLMQPGVASLQFKGPIRMQFATNPYSGIVILKWENNEKVVNLYSKRNEIRDVIVAPGLAYKNRVTYPIILSSFVLLGFSLAAALVLLNWRNLYHWIFFLFLLMAAYLTLAAYYPGVFSNDSADQLREAMSGNYGDWHPPLMAWVWAQLLKATGSIESLLILHLLVLSVAAVFWARILEISGLYVWTPLIALFLATPVVINFAGVLWKDVGFSFSLFLSCGIVGLAFMKRRITAVRTIAVLCLSAYAFGVRTNGIFALVPVIFMLFWTIIAQRKPGSSQCTTIAYSAIASIIALAAVVGGVQLLSYGYIKAQKRYPIQYLELYDIAGISSISGVDYFPEYIKRAPQYSKDKVAEEYAKSILWGNANNLIMRRPDGLPSLLPRNTDAGLQAELRASWLNAISREPSAYMKHRFAVFNFLMSEGYYPYVGPQSHTDRNLILQAHFASEERVPDVSDSRVPGAINAKTVVSSILALSNGSFLYVGWFWLILLTFQLLIGLTVMRPARVGLVIAMVSASGMLYIFPYIVVAPASDFRYLYWSALAGGLSAILILAITANAIHEKLVSVFSRRREVCNSMP